MSDTKHDYRVKVLLQKVKGFFFGGLDKIFARAREEALKYKNNWQTVNLNSFVEKFTPGSKGVISEDGRKIYYNNKKNGLRVIADVAGGYCRLEDTTKKGRERFLDIDGKDSRNYINEKGKLQGRSRSQFNEVTHFRILKREEM